MSSSVETKPGQHSQKYVEFDEFIEYQVEKTRASIRLTDILTAFAAVAALLVGYLIVFSLLDHWFIDGGFSPSTRGFMLLGVLAVSAGWLAWKGLFPYLHQVSGLFAAREIERSTPQMKGNLLSLVDLDRAQREV